MPAGAHEATLSFHPAPESVAEARRFTESVLGRWGLEEIAADAALVVSELVTNAVLHARTPIEFRLARVSDAVRIEVCDGSTAPVMPKAVVPAAIGPSLLDDDADLELLEELLNVGATTGRGIQLVSRLSSEWGYEILPGEAGKKVWAVVGTEPHHETPSADPASEAPAASASPGRDTPRSHPVRLVAVPVWLALESELQLDALVREFQMIEANGEVPEGRDSHVERARHFLDGLGPAFRAAQVALRRALERGDRLFDADFLVPLALVPQIRGLTDLLDEASEFSERGELLALAPSGAVRRFRRWYAEEIDRQAGGQPPRPCPFSTVSSEHATDAISRDELSAEEQALVQRVEADLTQATDLREVVRAFLTEAISSLGVEHASIVVVAHDSDLVELVDSIGMSGGVSEHWSSFRVGDDVPASEVIRTGEPVVIRTRSELFLRYPAFRGTPVLDDFAFACIPLTPTGAERATGCLNLSFSTSRDLTRAQLRMLCAIGSRLADSLGRQAGDHREEEFRARRRSFDRLVAAAPRGAPVEQALLWAVDALAELFDGWCGAFVTDEAGHTNVLAARQTDRARQQLMQDMQRRWPFRTEVGAVSRALQTGQAVVYQVVPEDLLATVATDDEHLEALRAVAFSSFMVAPVRFDGRVRGAIGIGRHDGRYLTDADVRLVEDLGKALGT